MLNFDDCPALFEEGLTDALDECGRGLCCDLNDAFARALGRSEYRTAMVHARGVGMKKLRLLGLQGDVLRALCPESQKIFLIPVCSVYAFYEGELLPPLGECGPMLHLDGGSSCRGCKGLVPEIEKLIGQRALLILPEKTVEALITEVIGLTLRAVSGDAILTVRIDCVDSLELPAGCEDE